MYFIFYEARSGQRQAWFEPTKFNLNVFHPDLKIRDVKDIVPFEP